MKAVLEHITKDLGHSFHCDKYQGLQFESPWHYHPQWELIHIKKGTGIAYIGNKIRNYSEDELVLVGSNLPHCWRNEATSGVQVESTYIQWDEKLLGDKWLEQPEFNAISNLLIHSQQGVIFKKESVVNIVKKLEQLTELPSFERLWSFISILHSLSEVEFTNISNDANFAINHQVTKRIEKLIAYVEDNYQNQISSADLADITHLTPSSFSKFFRKNFNKTFTAYLNEFRISKACILLGSNDKQIEEIAFLCGYNNMAFFHRRFKMLIGTSPALYRKRLKLITS